VGAYEVQWSERTTEADSNHHCKKCIVNGTSTVGAAMGKKENLLVNQLSVLRNFAMTSCGGRAREVS